MISMIFKYKKHLFFVLLFVLVLFFDFFNIEASSYRNLTSDEYIEFKNGYIPLENDKIDVRFLNYDISSQSDYDNDGLLDIEEIKVVDEQDGYKKLVYITNPFSDDTDGDGILDKEDNQPLTWNISSRDMILFQELVYRDPDYIRDVLTFPRTSPLQKYQNREEYLIMSQELAPFWELKEFISDDQSGFDAAIFTYKNKATKYFDFGEVNVVAFRGTTDGKDASTDLAIIFGSRTQQHTKAEELANRLKAEKLKNIYVTGHSLGGYLTGVFSAESRRIGNGEVKHAYTFNGLRVITNLFADGLRKEQVRIIDNELIPNNFFTSYATRVDGVVNGANRFPNPIYLSGGSHSSRSFFSDEYMDLKDFSVNKRRGLTSNTFNYNYLQNLNIENYQETEVKLKEITKNKPLERNVGKYQKITFNTGNNGYFGSDSVTTKDVWVLKSAVSGKTLKSAYDILENNLTIKNGFKHTGWNPSLDTPVSISDDTITVNANYESLPEITSENPNDMANQYYEIIFESGEHGSFSSSIKSKQVWVLKTANKTLQQVYEHLALNLEVEAGYQLSNWSVELSTNINKEITTKANYTQLAQILEKEPSQQSEQYHKVTFESGEHGSFSSSIKSKQVWVLKTANKTLQQVYEHLALNLEVEAGYQLSNWSVELSTNINKEITTKANYIKLNDSIVFDKDLFEVKTTSLIIDKNENVKISDLIINEYNDDYDETLKLPKNVSFEFVNEEDEVIAPSFDEGGIKEIKIKVVYNDLSFEYVYVRIYVNNDSETFLRKNPDVHAKALIYLGDLNKPTNEDVIFDEKPLNAKIVDVVSVESDEVGIKETSARLLFDDGSSIDNLRVVVTIIEKDSSAIPYIIPKNKKNILTVDESFNFIILKSDDISKINGEISVFINGQKVEYIENENGIYSVRLEGHKLNKDSVIEVVFVEENKKPSSVKGYVMDALSNQYEPFVKQITIKVDQKIYAKDLVLNIDSFPSDTKFMFVDEKKNEFTFDSSQIKKERVKIKTLYSDGTYDLSETIIIVEKENKAIVVVPFEKQNVTNETKEIKKIFISNEKEIVKDKTKNPSLENIFEDDRVIKGEAQPNSIVTLVLPGEKIINVNVDQTGKFKVILEQEIGKGVVKIKSQLENLLESEELTYEILTRTKKEEIKSEVKKDDATKENKEKVKIKSWSLIDIFSVVLNLLLLDVVLGNKIKSNAIKIILLLLIAFSLVLLSLTQSFTSEINFLTQYTKYFVSLNIIIFGLFKIATYKK